MKVALFEVCRRPMVPKENTEAIILSTCFKELGIEFELYSNDEYWSDRNGVSIRTAVRMVAAVGIERIVNRQFANRAVIGLGVRCVRIFRRAFVLGIEPASTTTIRTTVWHVRVP